MSESCLQSNTVDHSKNEPYSLVINQGPLSLEYLFLTVDEDKSNTLDAEEFCNLMRVAGLRGGRRGQITEDNAVSVMHELGYDSDGDGELDQFEVRKKIEYDGNHFK